MKDTTEAARELAEWINPDWPWASWHLQCIELAIEKARQEGRAEIAAEHYSDLAWATRWVLRLSVIGFVCMTVAAVISAYQGRWFNLIANTMTAGVIAVTLRFTHRMRKRAAGIQGTV